MEGRGGKGSPGGRPPPKRTYGSNKGSGRLFGPKYRQHQAGEERQPPPQSAAAASSSAAYRSATPPALLRPEPADARLTDGETCGSGAGLLLQQSARKFGRAVGGGGGVRSTEEISKLIRAAGEGGENGRTSAIALAQACKSRHSRRVIRANAGDFLSEMTSVLLVSLRVDEGDCRQRDEATVHGLAVAMFVLSKDRGLVKAFSASAVSALAVLIEGDGRRTTATGGAASVAATTGGRRHKSALPGGTLRPIDEKHSSGSGSCANGKGLSPFDMSDEDKEEQESRDGLGSSRGVGGASGGAISTGNDQSSSSSHTSVLDTTRRGELQHPRTNDHGSANAMVRARMLLDIADMVPWGMANRHLVSAADLGLATLLNVAAQACPESRERGGGAAGGSDVAGEDMGTQSSMGSQSELSSTIGSTADGQTDGGETTAVNDNAGVMAELSRLAPSGFLLPLVVGGATVLAELLSAEPLSRRRRDGVSADANADPSPLRAVHQLLLALRLLDLATLESSGEADGAAAKATTEARPGRSHHHAELTGALLVVVARCQPLCGDGAVADAAGRANEKVPAGRRFGQEGRKQQQPASSSPQLAVGGEVSGKVHQCLLAALRVLINVTHHDATICAEVAVKRGLETLMSCLVTRSCCPSRGSDAGDSGGLAAVQPRSDLELLGEVVNGDAEDFSGTGSEEGTGGVGQADATRGDFDAQVLTMSALINCVELKESAHNCVAMASLAVNPPSAEGERTSGAGRHQQQSRSFAGDLISSRCLAPEFLAKLLIRSTRSFAHQLEAGRQGEEDEDGPASPASCRAPEHARRGKTTDRSSKEGADSSGPLAAPPSAEATASAASGGPQGADGGEQLMSHAEGTDLVLGGHCALLLGLLVRGHDSNRRLALSVLPDGDPTLIVRVLEAFMALQFQAGVLTEEIVLAVQGLVEELEGLEPVPTKEWNPFEIDAADQDEDVGVSSPPPHATDLHNVTTASPQRGRKRPRTATTSGKMPAGVQRTFVTPPSGQWAVEGGQGIDSAEDFTLSVKRTQAASQGEDTSSSWLTQSPSSEETPPPELPGPSSSSVSVPTKAASEERPITATPPRKGSGGSDASETPQSSGRTPGSTRAASSWRVAGSSIAGRIGMGLRGRSASTTRSWLGSSPQLRTYRNRSIYGSQTLRKSSSSRPRGDLYSSCSDRQTEAPVGRGGGPSSAVFEILSDDSEESTQGLGGGGSGGGSVNDGAGGATSSVGSGGVGPRSGQNGPLAATTTSSKFDLDDWSDSSNDDPPQRKKRKPAAKSKATRVATCQLHSLGNPQVKCSGGGTDGDNFGSGTSDDGGASRWTKSDRSRSRSPSPKTRPVGAQAAGGGPRPFQGVGPRSGFSGKEMSRVVTPALGAGLKFSARERPGMANGGVISRPATSRPLNSSVSEWRVGAGAHLGRIEGQSADVSRVATALRPSAPGDKGSSKGRLAVTKASAIRGGPGVEGAVGKGKGVPDNPESRNVFEMSEEDESD